MRLRCRADEQLVRFLVCQLLTKTWRFYTVLSLDGVIYDVTSYLQETGARFERGMVLLHHLKESPEVSVDKLVALAQSLQDDSDVAMHENCKQARDDNMVIT